MQGANKWQWWAKPAAWAFYFVIVFEILFMISPFALHFYSAYGPALNVLHGSAATSWLTHFYLPHFSVTDSEVLNGLRRVGFWLIRGGGVLFLLAAVPLYASKLLLRGAVTWGFYRWVRHPQYVALAVMGVGTSLVWPRFLVGLTLVTMVYLYYFLARWEEDLCVEKYGEGFAEYVERTGMFLPKVLERPVSRAVPRVLPAAGFGRVVGAVGLWLVLAAGTVLGMRALQSVSLSHVSGVYDPAVAVISPARIDESTLRRVYELAERDGRVHERTGAVDDRGGPVTPYLVYVVPESWRLPDVPMDREHKRGGHHTPGDFDPNLYKVLFTKVRTYSPEATGRDIVLRAHGRVPLVLAHVDLGAGEDGAGAVVGVSDPPETVRWGDIPTPLF